MTKCSNKWCSNVAEEGECLKCEKMRQEAFIERTEQLEYDMACTEWIHLQD